MGLVCGGGVGGGVGGDEGNNGIEVMEVKQGRSSGLGREDRTHI